MPERGYETMDPLPSIPALLRDIEGIYGRAILSQGGTRSKPVGFQRKGAASPSPDFDALRDAAEINDAIHRLTVELLRIRRRYWTELIAPVPDDIPGRSSFDAKDRQRKRIQNEYPAHWRNGEIAIVEGVTDRWVRELRGADRKRNQ